MRGVRCTCVSGVLMKHGKLGQVVEKALVLREQKHKYVKREKEALNICAHPLVVHLFCTFQVNPKPEP